MIYKLILKPFNNSWDILLLRKALCRKILEKEKVATENKKKRNYQSNANLSVCSINSISMTTARKIKISWY